MTRANLTWGQKSCDRCDAVTSELGRVILHRDTDLQEKETSYYDLCPRCMTHLDTFLTYQEDEA